MCDEAYDYELSDSSLSADDEHECAIHANVASPDNDQGKAQADKASATETTDSESMYLSDALSEAGVTPKRRRGRTSSAARKREQLREWTEPLPLRQPYTQDNPCCKKQTPCCMYFDAQVEEWRTTYLYSRLSDDVLRQRLKKLREVSIADCVLKTGSTIMTPVSRFSTMAFSPFLKNI